MHIFIRILFRWPEICRVIF